MTITPHRADFPTAGDEFPASTLAELVADHVRDIATRSVPYLASLAECQLPHKGKGTDGARFLSHVAGQTADALGELLDELGPDATAAEITAAVDEFKGDDAARDLAEGAPDVVTVTRWAEFTDLHAWSEDVLAEFGPGDDLSHVALREIARRLVDALADEVVQVAEGLDEDGED